MPVSKEDSKIFASDTFTVRAAMAANNHFPAWDFFNELPPLEKAKLQQLFDYIAAVGVIRNPEKFKKVETYIDLFEFKNHQLRMPCFWDHGKQLFVTHGFKKKQTRAADSELKRAQQIRDAHRLYFKGSR